MPRQQKFMDLGFVHIHSKARHETRRLCSCCGKWISVIEIGFCRYRFVEISYTIKYKSTALPYNEIVCKCENHICTNTKDSFCAKARVKQVHKELLMDEQRNKPLVMEVI